MHAVVVRSFLEVCVPGHLGDACRRQSYRSHKTCVLDGSQRLRMDRGIRDVLKAFWTGELR